jgi:hypothetical protein
VLFVGFFSYKFVFFSLYKALEINFNGYITVQKGKRVRLVPPMQREQA